MKFKFEGLMAPVLTPFKDDSTQSLNLDVIQQYAEFLAANGITGVLVNGTSGEGMSMTIHERKEVTEAWAKAVKSTKQTLMVQVGGACLNDVKDMAAHCENLKVDGLLCLPELFNKPNCIDDLIRYLSYVAKAAPKTPLLYYHLPAYTGVNFDMKMFLDKAAKQIPTFAGAKYTHTNLQEGISCLSANSGNISLFLGCDQVLVGAFSLGMDSAIATTLNMLPNLGIQILNLTKNNNVKEALKYQMKLNDAIEVICEDGGWVATMKAAMNLMTPINVGSPRPPLAALTTPEIHKMKDALQLKNILK